MKILVTGANGYLGTGIVQALIEKGVQVIASDLKVENIDPRAKIIESDLFSIPDPYEFFEKPDVLLHLTWRDGFKHFSDAHIDDLPKHYHFLNKMAVSGCKHISVMGSMHEVGFFEGCVSENTPCNPVTPYGIAKNSLRELTKIICRKNGCIFQWLRGYYIVGNSKFGSSIFSKITAAEEDKQKEFPFTMGQNQYDFIDYEEFCSQVACSVVQEKVNGIINICSGRPEKLATIVEKFINKNHYNIKLKYGAFPDRPYDSKAIWADNTKIKNILENI